MTSSEQPIKQHQRPPQCQPKPRWDPNPWLQRQPIPWLDSNPQLQRQAKALPQCQAKPRWDSNPRLLPQKEVVAIERPVIHNGIIIAGYTIRARPKNPPIPDSARVKRVPGPVPILTANIPQTDPIQLFTSRVIWAEWSLSIKQYPASPLSHTVQDTWEEQNCTINGNIQININK